MLLGCPRALQGWTPTPCSVASENQDSTLPVGQWDPQGHPLFAMLLPAQITGKSSASAFRATLNLTTQGATVLLPACPVCVLSDAAPGGAIPVLALLHGRNSVTRPGRCLFHNWHHSKWEPLCQLEPFRTTVWVRASLSVRHCALGRNKVLLLKPLRQWPLSVPEAPRPTWTIRVVAHHLRPALLPSQHRGRRGRGGLPASCVPHS